MKIIFSDCRSCCSRTRHEICAQFEEESDSDALWHEKDTWSIIRCLGCLTYSFHYRKDDYDDVEEDEHGNVTHDVTIDSYPPVISRHRTLQNTYFLPHLIGKIYQQTIKAFSQNAFVLASIGLRACIEAVCNHLDISGTNLQRRIDQLFKAGHVSNGDKKRLHAIRFLGNDAAHDIKEPSHYDMRIALEIVEHLLNSVFILERRASNLETQVDNYTDFKTLICSCAATYTEKNPISLIGLLGRRKRLIATSIDSLEDELKTEIAAKKISYLSLGSIQEADGKQVQLYEVDIKAAILADDTIPF